MFSARGVLVFVAFSCIVFSCEAQRFLALDRSGHIRRVHFYVGDKLKVKLQGSPNWLSGEIQFIADSMININDSIFPVSTITAIRYNSSHSGTNLLGQATFLLPIAGATLLGIAALNSVITNQYPMYSQGLLITAGALIVAGPVAYSFTIHRYKINKRHRLKVMDITVR